MFRLICVGRLNGNQNLAQEFYHYHKMLNYKLEIIEIEVKKKLDIPELKKLEAALISEKIAPGQLNIMLQEQGQEYSSHEFSRFISNITAKHRIINFVIAGAYGFDISLQEKSNYSLSLSKMTFPHLMARVLLIEQLYRTQTIISNHPYHK